MTKRKTDLLIGFMIGFSAYVIHLIINHSTIEVIIK